LTGERAHYELAAGRNEEAERLLRAMENFAGESGLLPEQIWDTEDLPQKDLYFGRPSGSAMPLVWAHAEYVKLRRSLHDGRVFDLPRRAAQRYVVEKQGSSHAIWRFDQPRRAFSVSRTLRLEVMASAVVRWTCDGWKTAHETESQDTGLGVHLADLPTESLPGGSEVIFTFRWQKTGRWEGRDFHVLVEENSVEDSRFDAVTNIRSEAAGPPILKGGRHVQGKSESSTRGSNRKRPTGGNAR
jgi:glucoamylase